MQTVKPGFLFTAQLISVAITSFATVAGIHTGTEKVEVTIPPPDSDASCPWKVAAKAESIGDEEDDSNAEFESVMIRCEDIQEGIVLWLSPGISYSIEWRDADNNVFRVDSVTPFAPPKPQKK